MAGTEAFAVYIKVSRVDAGITVGWRAAGVAGRYTGRAGGRIGRVVAAWTGCQTVAAIQVMVQEVGWQAGSAISW